MSAVPSDLSAQTLRDLGAALIGRAKALEEAQPDRRARRRLTPAGVDRLAEIVAGGSIPSVGFWRRYSEMSDGADAG